MQDGSPIEVTVLIVVIAQEGNFNQAAERLEIIPTSLTRRVASLERDIGVKLFVRSTRSVVLTAASSLFVQESSLSLSHAERAWDLGRFQVEVDSGPYRVGYSPYTYSAVLPLLYGASPVLHPSGDEPSGVVVETAKSLELVEPVLRGRLQAVLCVGPITDSGLWVQLVGQEGFTACISRDHRFCAEK
jgi:DNA-binding transcriptional LysR family regulator